MKKNTMMRLASALLVAVLLTTCAIAGTFARYATTNSGSDNARVAKWGVTITTTGDMFADSYKDVATTYVDDEDVDTITVQASVATNDVVAPGTNGTLAAFDIAGTPEVDTKVTYTADLVLTGWAVDLTDDSVDNATVYCPIVITVNGASFKVGDTGIADTAALETKVEAAIVAATANYHTNDNLSAVEDDLVVTWAWAIGPEEATDPTNVSDTALGDAATAATISLTVSATITQVD